MSASFIGTWCRWLSILATVALNSATRCFACWTMSVLVASEASACCTSRSAWTLRRSVASWLARAAPSAVSACSKSRRATRPAWTSLRWRSISRPACTAGAFAPLASAAAGAGAGGGGSLAPQHRFRLVHRGLACRRGGPRALGGAARLVSLRLGHPARHGELGARGEQGCLRHRHRRRRLIALGAEVARVEAQENVARLDLLVVLHEELDQDAHDLGTDDGHRALDVGVIRRDLNARLPRYPAAVQTTHH